MWREYQTLARLRRRLSRRQIRFGRIDATSQRLVRRLESAGVIVPSGGDYRYRSLSAQRHITGGWLEELAYCAILAAGAEEAYYAQKVAWVIEGAQGHNEIDVIARRGGLLTFISCKTASPFFRGDRRSRERLESQILETHYWDQHFSDGTGRAVLLLTSDLVNEARRRSRSPTLMARAKVLDVDVIGRDFFNWNKLVGALREHWNDPPA